MRTRTRVFLGIGIGVPLLGALAGAAYADQFRDVALPGVRIAGASVTGLSQEQVTDRLTQRVAATTVTWTAGTTSHTATLADLGATVDVGATVDAAFAGNATFLHRIVALVDPTEVTPVVHVDDAALTAAADAIAAQVGGAPTDATVTLAGDGTSFVTTPAVDGTGVDVAALRAVVSSAATGLTSASTRLGFVTAAPTVSTAAAQQVADRANALVATSVQVSDGTDEVTAGAAEKASWVTVPSTATGLGAPTVDATKVSAWVAQVAADAATDPVQGVRYVDATGAVLSVLKKPVDGRSVSNTDAIATALTTALSAGQAYSGTLEYTTVAADWQSKQVASAADVLAYAPADGEKWIDVNLTAHTMTAYQGTTVAFGPVAMVNGAKATPTVVGTFHIYLKLPLQTMRGLNADGTNYETPDVPWISYFYSGYALHGAYWRSRFGYAASHGCVNLPVSTAKWVYDWAPVGTAVVTHR